MPTLQRTAQGEADLNASWLHVDHVDLGAADHRLEDDDAKCLRLADKPGLGEEHPDIALGPR